jgi:hypothetical protein
LLTLSGAPTGAAAGAWRVRLGSADATITSSAADAIARTAALAFLAPVTAAPATVMGLVVFPDSADRGGGNCSADCCADGAACAVVGACGVGARFACFRVEYWDDAAPYIASASPLSGYLPPPRHSLTLSYPDTNVNINTLCSYLRSIPVVHFCFHPSFPYLFLALQRPKYSRY